MTSRGLLPRVAQKVYVTKGNVLEYEVTRTCEAFNFIAKSVGD